MPYRRRYRKRNLRRRPLRRKPRMMRKVNPNVHNFKRSVDITNLVGGSLTTSGQIVASGNVLRYTQGNVAIVSNYYGSVGLSFSLSDLPSFTEFTTLYDQYRICAVKLTIVPFNTQTLGGQDSGNTANVGILIHHAVDNDNAPAPSPSASGVDTLRQYRTYRCQQSMDPKRMSLTRYIRPRVSMEIYNSTISTGYGLGKRNQWIDSSSPDIPHYGFRAVFEGNAGNTGDTQDYKIFATYYIQCKNPI